MTPLQSATAAYLAANRAHHEAAKTMEAAESALDTAVHEALAAHFKQAFIFREEFQAFADHATITCRWEQDITIWRAVARISALDGNTRSTFEWTHCDADSPADAVRAALDSLRDHILNNGCDRATSDAVHRLNSAIWGTNDCQP